MDKPYRGSLTILERLTESPAPSLSRIYQDRRDAAETIERLTRELDEALIERENMQNLLMGSHDAQVLINVRSKLATAEAQRDGALTPDQREAAAKALAAKMLSTEWTDLRPFTRAKYRSAILTMERIIRAAKGAA